MRISCPACAKTKSRYAFTKLGFVYEDCDDCGTLFVNPRPATAAFDHYYQNAPSVEFWATDFYRDTAEARRKAIFKPRAKLILDLVAEHLGPNPSSIIDIGSGYGILCDELRKLVASDVGIIAVEPAPALSDTCRSMGLNVIPLFANAVTEAQIRQFEKPDVPLRAATCFELLEHLYDPLAFLLDIGRLIGPGGMLVATTLNGLGFDLAVLREHSKSIHPPHHINFFNPESVKQLFERAGFIVKEISTPGRLDVDIADKQKDDVADLFLRQLLDMDKDVKARFQSFLREAGLSSHMMVVAKRSEY